MGRWYSIGGMGFYLGVLVVCLGLFWLLRTR